MNASSDILKIQDEDTLKAYLGTQSRHVAQTIAFRAAARVLPIFEEDMIRQGKLWLIGTWRCNLENMLLTASKLTREDQINTDYREGIAAYVTATYAGECLRGGECEFADSTAFANWSHNNKKKEPSHYATLAVVCAFDAFAYYREKDFIDIVPSDFWTIIQNDFRHMREKGCDLVSWPLWPVRMPDHIQKSWGQVKAARTGPDWAFWINWYEALLTGQPQNWDTLRKVALISDMDWRKGATHVNRRIDQIVAKANST